MFNGSNKLWYAKRAKNTLLRFVHSMSISYHIIYNPNAAGGRSRNLIEVVMPEMQEKGLKIFLHKTKCIGHATDIITELITGQPMNIVAAGGDGTVSEVANGILKNPSRESIRFGIIPLGTGNDFIKDFGVFSVEESIVRLLKNGSQRIDVGKLTVTDPHQDEPYYFLNMFGLGVVARGAKLRRDVYSWAGKLGYHLAFFHMLPSLQSGKITIAINNQKPLQIHSPILGVCNSQYTGHGMRVSPQSSTSDGEFDLIYTENTGSWELLKLFALLSTGKHINHPQVRYQTVQQLDIELEKTSDFMLDGEVRSGRSFRFEILPQALKFIL